MDIAQNVSNCPIFPSFSGVSKDKSSKRRMPSYILIAFPEKLIYKNTSREFG